MNHNKELEELARLLTHLPGLGKRSSNRMILQLLKQNDALMKPLAKQMLKVAENVSICEECGNITIGESCPICVDKTRDQSIICVVADVADIWALERSKTFKGLYHVLGGVLSALNGVNVEDLRIEQLITRASNDVVKEIIIALPATMDGQTTAYLISEELKKLELKISRPAVGIPFGGELDYLDEGTISTAFQSRVKF